MTPTTTAVTAYNAAAAAADAAALAAGFVDLLSANGTVLASVPLGTPTAAGAVCTGGGFPKPVEALAAGTAASARTRTAADAVWGTAATVGTTGTEVVLSSLVIAAGQTINVASVTLTHTGAAA